MKKTAWGWCLFLLLSGMILGAPFLRLDRPNGGETLAPGSAFEISWTAREITQNVALVLHRNDLRVGVIAGSLAPGSSPFRWTVGRLVDGTAAPGGGYTVRVRTLDSSLRDESDGEFAIGTAPAGGEPDFEAQELTLYYKWEPDINQGKVMTLQAVLKWVNNGADFQGPLKIRYMYMDALKGSKISKDAVLELPSVSAVRNKGCSQFLCTVDKIPEGVESISFAAMIDPGNQVKESDEKNNFKENTAQLSRQPDLAFEEYHVSSSQFYNDDLIEITFKVRNKGIEPARQFNVRVALEDMQYNVGTTIYSATIPELAGGSSLPLRAQFRPIAMTPHTGYFAFSADYDKRLKEANEFNNERWILYKLEPAADLSFERARAWEESMLLHCEFVVANKGYAIEEDAWAYVYARVDGLDRLVTKMALGKVYVGDRQLFHAAGQWLWQRGDHPIRIIIDDCCRLSGGERDPRYHDANPANNRIEVKCDWEYPPAPTP